MSKWIRWQRDSEGEANLKKSNEIIPEISTSKKYFESSINLVVSKWNYQLINFCKKKLTNRRKLHTPKYYIYRWIKSREKITNSCINIVTQTECSASNQTLSIEKNRVLFFPFAVFIYGRYAWKLRAINGLLVAALVHFSVTNVYYMFMQSIFWKIVDFGFGAKNGVNNSNVYFTHFVHVGNTQSFHGRLCARFSF